MLKEDRADILLGILTDQRQGVKINSAELADRLGIRHQRSFDRRIREMVETLRLKTVTALGDDFGYWISDDPDEIFRYCQEARRDARKAYRTRIASVRALERGARRLLEVGGQIEFQI